MSNLSQLAREALSLPLDDRLQLAEQLWASVYAPPETPAVNEENEALATADRRNAELESGMALGVPHADAMEQARKALECK